ncbi:MAG: RluA family pseudouridine synthase, partial [Bacteroidaceae bacterium]
MNVVYEDNHILIAQKKAGEIVQGDKTGDTPLSDMVKAYIKEKYHRPGNVFVGVVHRLDRPVSGLVCFARTSKALSRLCAMFASHEQVKKTYWALVCKRPPQDEGTLVNWLTRDAKRNMARAYDHEVPGSKKAVLDYKLLAATDRYFL